jgi:hypothetical protein
MKVTDLEVRFRELTLLMYDTKVALPVLEERVSPHLAEDVEFVDPWLRARGDRRFMIGLRGFHCVIRFDFTIFQIGVHLDEDGGTGRTLVDGVMNLMQLGFWTYPLRTVLVYDFRLTGEEENLQITRLTEMWSFGDMIAAAPFLVGRFYDRVFRPLSGEFFTAAFWLGCALRGQRAPATHHADSSIEP